MPMTNVNNFDTYPLGSAICYSAKTSYYDCEEDEHFSPRPLTALLSSTGVLQLVPFVDNLSLRTDKNTVSEFPTQEIFEAARSRLTKSAYLDVVSNSVIENAQENSIHEENKYENFIQIQPVGSGLQIEENMKLTLNLHLESEADAESVVSSKNDFKVVQVITEHENTTTTTTTTTSINTNVSNSVDNDQIPLHIDKISNLILRERQALKSPSKPTSLVINNPLSTSVEMNTTNVSNYSFSNEINLQSLNLGKDNENISFKNNIPNNESKNSMVVDTNTQEVVVKDNPNVFNMNTFLGNSVPSSVFSAQLSSPKAGLADTSSTLTSSFSFPKSNVSSTSWQSSDSSATKPLTAVGSSIFSATSGNVSQFSFEKSNNSAIFSPSNMNSSPTPNKNIDHTLSSSEIKNSLIEDSNNISDFINQLGDYYVDPLIDYALIYPDFDFGSFDVSNFLREEDLKFSSDLSKKFNLTIPDNFPSESKIILEKFYEKLKSLQHSIGKIPKLFDFNELTGIVNQTKKFAWDIDEKNKYAEHLLHRAFTWSHINYSLY